MSRTPRQVGVAGDGAPLEHLSEVTCNAVITVVREHSRRSYCRRHVATWEGAKPFERRVKGVATLTELGGQGRAFRDRKVRPLS